MAEIKPNKKQQECIDNICGKYLVLAGPGTGKTFTIVERIKNMLREKEMSVLLVNLIIMFKNALPIVDYLFGEYMI